MDNDVEGITPAEQMAWSAFRQLDDAILGLEQLHNPESLCIALGGALYIVQQRYNLRGAEAFSLMYSGWLNPPGLFDVQKLLKDVDQMTEEVQSLKQALVDLKLKYEVRQ